MLPGWVGCAWLKTKSRQTPPERRRQPGLAAPQASRLSQDVQTPGVETKVSTPGVSKLAVRYLALVWLQPAGSTAAAVGRPKRRPGCLRTGLTEGSARSKCGGHNPAAWRERKTFLPASSLGDHAEPHTCATAGRSLCGAKSGRRRPGSNPADWPWLREGWQAKAPAKAPAPQLPQTVAKCRNSRGRRSRPASGSWTWP